MSLHEFAYKMQGPQVDLAELEAFEQEIGGVLDRRYREFLLAMNGGVAYPELKCELTNPEYPITVFYSLEDGYRGLRRTFFDLAELLGITDEVTGESRHLLPIASDNGNRDLCILIGAELSPVYLVPQELDQNDSPPAIRKVANDFAEFVGSLAQDKLTTCSIEELAKGSWTAVQEYLDAGGDLNGKSESGLSLLCQSIRCANRGVFDGLLAQEPDLADALRVAVTNCDLHAVEKLVEAGCSPSDGIRFAVGPKRRDIRQFLVTQAEA